LFCGLRSYIACTMNSTSKQTITASAPLPAWSPETAARLGDCRVLLVGVGGVGSWCADALVRSGVRRLTLVDSDVVCPTNINRQLQATTRNVGAVKVQELRQWLLRLAPDAEITAEKLLYDESSCDQFDLGQYDYVLDAIDSLKCKLLLLRRALAAPCTLFSSMGAGAKVDPTLIRVGPASKTRDCPLARAVRKRLHAAGVLDDFLCVYSSETPLPSRGGTFCGSAVCACPDKNEKNLCLDKARINGSLAQVTAPFGATLAWLVIRDALTSNP
jgi:tRNA A37 threonylcarbamoyladenosine dehydratase